MVTVIVISYWDWSGLVTSCRSCFISRGWLNIFYIKDYVVIIIDVIIGLQRMKLPMLNRIHKL